MYGFYGIAGYGWVLCEGVSFMKGLIPIRMPDCVVRAECIVPPRTDSRWGVPVPADILPWCIVSRLPLTGTYAGLWAGSTGRIPRADSTGRFHGQVPRAGSSRVDSRRRRTLSSVPHLNRLAPSIDDDASIRLQISHSLHASACRLHCMHACTMPLHAWYYMHACRVHCMDM